MGSLRDHVLAVLEDEPRKRELLTGLLEKPCRFLVLEDFNTFGLLGDVHAPMEPPAGEENHFYYFFRAEGKSGKRKAELGSWGIGKYVFPKASNVNSFFALTVRDSPNGADPESYLMGQAVLKYHTLDETRWSPDGYWAEKDEGFPIPIIAQDEIASLRTTFRVSRTTEPGLSVVIPYADESLDYDGIRDAIATDFYAAIIEDRLVVDIEGHGREPITLDSASFDDILDVLSPDLGPDLREELNLYFAAVQADSPTVELSAPSNRPVWSSERFTAEERAQIRETLDQGGIAKIRVPVIVTTGDDEPKETWFDVTLIHDDNAPGIPKFVRRGLIVTDAVRRRAQALRRYRALVRVEDDVLVTFLGDAEGPAHNDWTPNREHFRNKGYKFGRAIIDFVLSAPKQIITLIREDEETEDDLAAASYFPRLDEEGKKDLKTDEDDGTMEPDSTDEPKPPPRPDPSPFDVSKSPDGFSVTLNERGHDVSMLTVDMAYDRRRGDPFKKWALTDFDLTSEDSGLTVELAGAVGEAAPNQLRLRISEPSEFTAKVTGFDSRRDLIVRVRAGDPS